MIEFLILPPIHTIGFRHAFQYVLKVFIDLFQLLQIDCKLLQIDYIKKIHYKRGKFAMDQNTCELLLNCRMNYFKTTDK